MHGYMNHRAVSEWGPLIARTLLSIVFIYAGWTKITGFAGVVGYISSVGLPLPEVLAVLAIIVEVGGGLMLLTGFMGRIAAKALFGFTLLATVFFHTAWSDPMQMTMALKNMAIMGGLLMVFVHGSGPKSIGCWCKKCEHDGKCHICEGGKCEEDDHHV